MFWNGGWAPFVVFPLVMLVVMPVMVTVMTRMWGRGGWPPFSRSGLDDRPARWSSGEDPLTVPLERYARGEIDQEEFERILDGLQRSERRQGNAPKSFRSDR